MTSAHQICSSDLGMAPEDVYSWDPRILNMKLMNVILVVAGVLGGGTEFYVHFLESLWPWRVPKTKVKKRSWTIWVAKKNAGMYYTGVAPSPVTVIEWGIITFSLRDPEVNLHLPWWVGGGTQDVPQNSYVPFKCIMLRQLQLPTISRNTSNCTFRSLGRHPIGLNFNDKLSAQTKGLLPFTINL